MAADRQPFGARELVGALQDRAVDRDLAEVVQAARPPQPSDLRPGEPQRLAEARDVLGDALGVPVGRRGAFIDDVREGLERTCRLPTQGRETLVRLEDGEDERDEGQDCPRLLDRQHRQREAEPGLADDGRKLAAQLFALERQERKPGKERDDGGDEQRVDGEHRGGENGDRPKVSRQAHHARDAAEQLVHETANDARDREDARVVGDAPERPAANTIGGEDAARGNERSGPRPEQEHRGDLHTRREAEGVRIQRIERALVRRHLHQLGQHGGCAKQGEHGQTGVCALDDGCHKGDGAGRQYEGDPRIRFVPDAHG